jgi:retron-type reverse transcriptase
LLEILQSKNNPNLFLKSIIAIYSDNKKVKINNQLSEEHPINHGVRQGCPLSPTLFNIYMNEIIVKWKTIYTKGITLSTSTKINTLLFADDQVIIADSEDNLHYKT